jgi:hypothetical protein
VDLIGTRNTIGGTDYGEANTIAFNGAHGISIENGGGNTNNAILRNSIFQNTELGINLGNPGVTTTDRHHRRAGNAQAHQRRRPQPRANHRARSCWRRSRRRHGKRDLFSHQRRDFVRPVRESMGEKTGTKDRKVRNACSLCFLRGLL